MVVRGERGLANLREEVFEAVGRVEACAHDEGIYEEPDEGFDIRQVSVCDGGTDQDVSLARMSKQQHVERGEQGHVERC